MAEPDVGHAVQTLAALKPPPRWPQAILGVALVVLAVAGLVIGLRLMNTAAQVRSNGQAIRTSCTLLANAILQSGAGGPGLQPSPQAQLTELYVSVVREHMTHTQKREERRLLQSIAVAGAAIPLPDCVRVAKHPDSVSTVPTIPPRR